MSRTDKTWKLQPNSWVGPDKPWRLLEGKELKPMFDEWGRPAKLTLPLQGEGDGPYPVVDLVPVRQREACIGFEPDYKLVVLVQKYDNTVPAPTLKGIVWCVAERDMGDGTPTDPEPIGLWGAEEREGNEWPPRP